MGVRSLGNTLAAAFEQAAMALTPVITAPQTLTPQEVVTISGEAPAGESLVADWLNALLDEMATARPSVAGGDR